MIGEDFGSYRILDKIGSGGMGEVFRARDERLGREIALKVLLPETAGDADSRARMVHEARTASALNHPHICTVYEAGEANGQVYIAMEWVKGKSLRDLRGAVGLPVDSVVHHGIQIAEALAHAHEHGVIHGDLKSSNVVVTPDGRAMVLDFGLARHLPAKETREITEVLELSPIARPETSSENTSEATVSQERRSAPAGTLFYMAPEVLQGQRVNARSDIWALGVVLYELCCGYRPFDRPTTVETSRAILQEPPPPLPATVPAGLRAIIQKCLAKEPQRRYQHASQVASALAMVNFEIEAGAAFRAGPGKSAWEKWGGPAMAAGLGALLGAGLFWQAGGQRAVVSREGVQFAITLPSDEALHDYASASVAFSPDGTQLAYVSNRGDVRGIYIRSLSSLTPRWVAGSEGGSSPSFSPDGRWLAFEAGSELKRISLDGGAAQFITDTPVFVGASWASNDTIVYVPVFNAGLWSVAASGGPARRLTTPSPQQGEHAHLWPEVLPGGKGALYTIWKGGSFDDAAIGVVSLATGERRTVIERGYHGRYAASGHIVYCHGSNLMVVPFDAKKARVTGEPTLLLEGVLGDRGVGAVVFSLSRNGSLAYAPGIVRAPLRRLAWADRGGKLAPLGDSPRPFSSPRISPDGRRVAMWLEDETTASVWVYELARDALTRITFGADDHSAVWSPDGRQIAFESSSPTGTHQLYVRRLDGTGAEKAITKGELERYLSDWSPDGRWLAYTEFHPESRADIWVVGVDPPEPPRPFLKTAFAEKEAVFSPDGRWVAYTSNESGQYEVYVRPFPGPGEKEQVSVGGGEEPAWARSGRELYYRSGGKMMAVAVTAQPTFTAGRPRELFSGLFHDNIVPNRSYDVAPDGRFLLVTGPEAESASRQINIVLDWMNDSHLRKRGR